jgi:crotonobetainyl-CoA:carnitine CoA-transferase CaiB-like acyl-CoA transferase
MATWSASQGWLPQRLANSAHQSIVPFQMLSAADGWLVVACAKESLWSRLCDAIGHPELAHDRRFNSFEARAEHREALVEILEGVFRTGTVQEWIVAHSAKGVPCARVTDLGEALDDVQSRARNNVVEYDHPHFGTVRTVASPFGSVLTVGPTRAPRLGEQTAELAG